MAASKKSSVATATPTEAKPTFNASAAAKKAISFKLATKKIAAKRPLSKAPATPKLADKSVKVKKPKLVRDSFTIPKTEFAVLEELKQRAAKLARPVKKSELIRAGIKALAALSNAAFLTAVNQVPIIKTGRPAL